MGRKVYPVKGEGYKIRVLKEIVTDSGIHIPMKTEKVKEKTKTTKKL